MLHDEKVLAVIPARQNSKGLPGKNIALLADKPLIGWSIDAAHQSPLVDHTIVSTDGQQISDIALSLGASVPFLRPAELATDAAPGIAPLLHACKAMPGFDIVVLLQPTSPLRTAEDIDAAILLMDEHDADFCVSMTTPKHHPNWLFAQTEEGFLSRYENQILCETRQSLPPLFAPNGAIYVARIEALLVQNTVFGQRLVAYPMTEARSFDIDTEVDLKICEALMAAA